ncbi:hypothetical protein ABIA70_002852 [Arthrobacter sp. 754]
MSPSARELATGGARAYGPCLMTSFALLSAKALDWCPRKAAIGILEVTTPPFRFSLQPGPLTAG